MEDSLERAARRIERLNGLLTITVIVLVVALIVIL
jgi:hypothetical protein